MKSACEIIQEYLDKKGLANKRVNGQFSLETSPITGEAKWHHFYISEDTGLWHDKKAGRGGNWEQFLALFGDSTLEYEAITSSTPIATEKEEVTRKVIPTEQVESYVEKLWGSENEIKDYVLNTRKITEKAARYFKLGRQTGFLSIPIFDSDGIATNIRYRKGPSFEQQEGSRYHSEPGCKSCLFNESALSLKPAEIIITEGELDAIQLWQRGFVNVVSTTLGAKNFPEEWVEKLKDVKKVYICFDNDEAGKSGALELSQKLGVERCKVIFLPEVSGKKCDVTDYFLTLGKSREDFVNLMTDAKSSVVLDNSIKHISEFSSELLQKLTVGSDEGIKTGYDGLDKIMGGLRKGRVVMLAGLTSVGKTSLSTNLALNVAYIAKKPTLYVSMEMPPIDLCKKFVQLVTHLTTEQLSSLNVERHIETLKDGFAAFRSEKGEIPLYFLDDTGEVNLKKVLAACRAAKHGYGVEAIVIDHLHYFGVSSNNRAAEIASIVRQVKALAMELQIPIVLLAHLNRGGRTMQRKGMYIPSLADLKESSAIEQDADQVLFVCRDSEAFVTEEKRKTILKLAKNRDGATGHVSLRFEMEYGYFGEIQGVDYLLELEEKPKFSKPAKTKKSDWDDNFSDIFK